MQKSVLLAVLVLIPLGYADAQIPQVERDALIALWNSTDGANWSDNTRWLEPVGTECEWYGVACVEGKLTRLDLSDNQLSGVIPPELGNLTDLYFLDLSDNLLGGVIPTELGNLSNLDDLYLNSNQLSGSIPPEIGNLYMWHGSTLDLSDNQLSGEIPPELGNLSKLGNLFLDSNQLSGSIPPELGSMRINHGIVDLSDNQLSGVIPPELGPEGAFTSNSWAWLDLSSNQLSGSIPPELGNLEVMQYLDLSDNQLSGVIPPELGGMDLSKLFLNSNQLSGSITTAGWAINLADGVGLDLRWNALHSDDTWVIATLNSKQVGGDWQSTQTIAPENFAVDLLGDHTVWLSWDAVSYQSDPGGYEAFSSPTGSGVWTSRGWANSKTETTFPVTWLDPAMSYSFAIVSFTDPHLNNLNMVDSNFTPQVMATTASVGCAQPIIEVAGVGPFTLSLLGSYDSYYWSTGEASPSIVVAPLSEQWFWVSVTSTGPCEEAAAISVGPITPEIFADGFESGDTSAWSATVP